MKKVIEVKGMSCAHCQTNVKNALNALIGVDAEVDLKKGIAVVTLTRDVPDEELKTAVNNAGYTAVSVVEKQGLFEKLRGKK
ncbi:MAG: heavy metal-associated domain-containing protein [Clostridia bacterium]